MSEHQVNKVSMPHSREFYYNSKANKNATKKLKRFFNRVIFSVMIAKKKLEIVSTQVMEKCNRCRLGQISLQGSHTRLTPSPANSLPIFKYDAFR